MYMIWTTPIFVLPATAVSAIRKLAGIYTDSPSHQVYSKNHRIKESCWSIALLPTWQCIGHHIALSLLILYIKVKTLQPDAPPSELGSWMWLVEDPCQGCVVDDNNKVAALEVSLPLLHPPHHPETLLRYQAILFSSKREAKMSNYVLLSVRSASA